MSLLNEYLTMVKKGLPKLDNIIEGWVNDIKLQKGELPEEEVIEILKRREICHTCPFNSENAKTSEDYFTTFKENYKTEREELHCSVCSCGIKKKTASLDEECGIASSKETKNFILKWNKYQKQ